MNKRLLVSLVVTLILTAVDTAEAQQTAKVAKIGELVVRSASTPAPGSELFRRALRELGYVEDKNVAFESRSAEGKLDRLPAAADDLVRLKVDVIVVASTAGALAAKNATRTIPVVFYSAG